jgi:hypothetical protein
MWGWSWGRFLIKGKTIYKAQRYPDIWRRGRDSNPRYGFPHTHFPGVRLQPLGHPSVARARPGTRAEGDSTGRYAGASSLARARQREAIQINANKRQ